MTEDDEVMTGDLEPSRSSAIAEAELEGQPSPAEPVESAPQWAKGAFHAGVAASGGLAGGSNPPGPQAPHVSAVPSPSPSAFFSGAKKAAVFVLSLDEEVASTLLRSLSDEELGRITGEIAH